MHRVPATQVLRDQRISPSLINPTNLRTSLRRKNRPITLRNLMVNSTKATINGRHRSVAIAQVTPSQNISHSIKQIKITLSRNVMNLIRIAILRIPFRHKMHPVKSHSRRSTANPCIRSICRTMPFLKARFHSLMANTNRHNSGHHALPTKANVRNRPSQFIRRSSILINMRRQRIRIKP